MVAGSQFQRHSKSYVRVSADSAQNSDTLLSKWEVMHEKCGLSKTVARILLVLFWIAVLGGATYFCLWYSGRLEPEPGLADPSALPEKASLPDVSTKEKSSTDTESNKDTTSDNKSNWAKFLDKTGWSKVTEFLSPAPAKPSPADELEKLGYGGGVGKPQTAKEVLELRDASKDPNHPAYNAIHALDKLHGHKHGTDHKHQWEHPLHAHGHHNLHGISWKHFLKEALGMVPRPVVNFGTRMAHDVPQWLHGKPLPAIKVIRIKLGPKKHHPKCENHPKNKGLSPKPDEKANDGLIPKGLEPPKAEPEEPKPVVADHVHAGHNHH